MASRVRPVPLRVLLVATASLLVAACGGGGSLVGPTDDTTDDTTRDTTDDTVDTVPATTTDTTEPERTTTTPAATTAPSTDPPVVPVVGNIDDIVIRTSVADLHRWWTRVFPAVYPGSEYSGPVAGAWSLRPGEQVECGPFVVTYTDVENNAIYAPCSETVDGIFFDTEQFIPTLVTNSGQFAGAFIAAHEWGHLIQARGREDNSIDVTQELQADCYAGAWVRHVLDDGVPFELGTNDIDVALAALIDVGDPVGIGPDTVGAHGSAFDRVSAFTAGLKDIQNCVTFQTDPPPIFEMPFTTPEEEENQGNLDIVTLFDLVTQDLNTFFLTEVDPNYPLPGDPIESDCDGRAVVLEWCPSLGAIAINAERLVAFHDFLGDWATATLLARAYADAAGIPAQVSNCITGAFDRALFLDVNANPKTYNLQLSSGDLDESARVFLIQSMGGDGIVSVDNLRTGLLEGLPACERLAQEG